MTLTEQLRETEKWIRDMGDQFVDPERIRKLFRAHADRIGKAAELAERWQIIDELRADPGHSVELFCDNEEKTIQRSAYVRGDLERRSGVSVGAEPIICAIEVCAEWLDWETRRYQGDTILECLRAAKAHMLKCNPETAKAEK